MKAVLSDYKSSYGIIIPGNCDMFNVNNDRSSNEPSIIVHRLTVRTLCKQSKINGHMMSEPCSKQHSVSDMKLLLSGDVEMNPGPVENVVSKSIRFSSQNNMLLASRLYRRGLRPLDVGGGGDCFFPRCCTPVVW